MPVHSTSKAIPGPWPIACVVVYISAVVQPLRCWSDSCLGATGLAADLAFLLSFCVIRVSWDCKSAICFFRSWISDL